MENAETFEKVDFCRVQDLEIGDKFMWHGVWFLVRDFQEHKGEEKLVFYQANGNTTCGGVKFLGAKSKQFVQVVKKTANGE